MIRAHRVEWLEAQGNVVVSAGDWPENFPAAVAEHEPDVVIVPDDPRFPPMANFGYHVAKDAFPNCQFTIVSENDLEFAASIRGVANVYRARTPLSLPFAENKRQIIHDMAYSKYASPKKLHVPERTDGWEITASSQEAKFLLQLQTGASDGRHQRAIKYFTLLRRFDRGLTWECGYRLGHASYKTAWLREQIGRWLTVLAHYIPDVEVEHCPPAQNPSSRFAYLDYEMPLTYGYPLVCVLNYGVRASVAEVIKNTAAWSFEGETEDQLAAIGCKLFGVNAYLSKVAQAQIWSMDQFLVRDSSLFRGAGGRNLRRTMGIYFEFWGWSYLWESGEGLLQIARGFHSGETRVERQGDAPMAPSFIDFRRIARGGQQAAGEA